MERMKVFIAEESYEGLSQVGIYKNEELVLQYDTLECDLDTVIEVLRRLEIDVQIRAIDSEWFYRYAEQDFPRILKDVKWNEK